MADIFNWPVRRFDGRMRRDAGTLTAAGVTALVSGGTALATKALSKPPSAPPVTPTPDQFSQKAKADEEERKRQQQGIAGTILDQNASGRSAPTYVNQNLGQ